MQWQADFLLFSLEYFPFTSSPSEIKLMAEFLVC